MSTFWGSSPSDGSSIMRIRGLDIMPRAIASTCCSPPESMPASRLKCSRRAAGSPGGTLLPMSDPASATAHQTAHQTTRQEAILQRTPDQQAEQDALNRMVRQCIAGDQHAWQQLVATQHRRIYGICYRFTGSAADAEDLTQDVFLKLYRNLASFDTQKGNFQTWLTTLTRNLLVDHFRRTRLERATDSLDASLSADDGGLSLAGRLADSRPSQEAHAAGLELK